MKRLLFAAAGAAVIVLAAFSSPSHAFTHYPNASCPDTLSIIRLKTLLNGVDPCSPLTSGTGGAPGDTVNGVGGIIIGFDEIPTGFDIYIEQTAGGVNSGIDVFEHGTNFRPSYGFNRGDSMVVEFARVSNFNGDVELEAPNNVFSAPNIVMRKVSTGNPLPPILHGNTTDFKETPTNSYIASYMTTLVTLDGPVRVARSATPPSSDPGLAFHGILVVRDASPGDSVFIDYNKLTTIVPPPDGTVLQSITGIVNNAARGYRIMPRDANDIVDTQPPGVTDGYAIADNQYRIVFDRPVTSATATNTANYSLASFGTVNTSVMDGTSAAILTVSGTGLAHGAQEIVSVNNIVGVANGIGMTTTNTATFLAGVLSCAEQAAPNPDTLLAIPCADKAIYSGPGGEFLNGGFGPRSTLTGIVTGIYGNLYYMEDSPPGRGETVFAPPVALTMGHSYVLAGNSQVYYSENEFAGISFVKDLGATSIPAPVALDFATAILDTCDVNQNITSGRDFLSDLVSLPTGKVVKRFATLPTTGFHIAGPAPDFADTIFIENQNNVLGAFDTTNVNYPPLNTYVNVVGCMHYTTNTSTPSFRVCPRTVADITIIGVAGATLPAPTLSFAAYPNPARSVQLSFSLPKTTDVQLGVFDIVGRRVTTLYSGQMVAGTYRKQWNGTDASGQKVHPGMYFYRLKAGNSTLTARSVVLTN